MINKTLFSIFKQGSKTYFYSSLFFPSYMKKDVFALYGFVRKADNYVDSIPQDINGFYNFKDKYYKAKDGADVDDIVIKGFIKLAEKNNFQDEWIDAFLHSMEMDITKSTYNTLDETIEYIYGSAEVIGLMMASIMKLPEESYSYARYLGRSMQYINFIRDIAEDITLNRNYFPQDEMRKHGLESLDYEYTINKKEEFMGFIQGQLQKYCDWQCIAEEGFNYIPNRFLIPVKTATEMYYWTAEQIYKNPFIVYHLKVKPMIKKIFTTTLLNIVDPRKPILDNRYCFNKITNPKLS